MAVRKIKGSWWVDFRHGVERYRKRSPLNSMAGAKEYEITLRARLARGEPLDERPADVNDPTFAAFAGVWLEIYVCTNNKPSEQYAKRGILQRHLLPWFRDKRLSRIGAQEIEAYKTAMVTAGFCAKSVNNHLAVLGKCLTCAVEWGHLAVRPTVKLLRVAPAKYTTVTPLERAALLSDTAEPMWNAMLRLALRTGMRPNEMTSVDWTDVDFDRGIVSVRTARWREFVGSPKNNRIRHLPLTEDVRRALLDLDRRGDLVFCRDDGRPLTDSMREKALMRICRRTGVRHIDWYTFRHTFASTLAAEGVPLPVIKELMGHATITMTMRYTHVTAAALRDAVTVLGRAERSEHEKNGQPVVNRVVQTTRSAPQRSLVAA